jgi:VWFA-related protein
VIVLALALSWLAASQQEEPSYRFNIEIRTVYADVFVTRDGMPVKGLSEGDFKVWDDGVRQEIRLLDQTELPLSTMLVLDMSQSVVDEGLDHLRAAAHAFMEELDPDDEVGLLTFTHEMQLRRTFGRGFAELHRVLDESMGIGTTALHDALYAGVKLVEARAGRPLVLLLTDGLDRTSWLTQQDVLEKLRASDAVVYAVGVERRPIAALNVGGRGRYKSAELPPGDFLRNVTWQTGGRACFLTPGANLKEIFLNVLEEMRNRYLLSYQPQGVPLEGWHTLEVEVDGFEKEEIRARPGYLVVTRN